MLEVVKRLHLVTTFVLVAASVLAEPSVVRIEKNQTGYRLVRDGKPYYIHGAGGKAKLDILTAAGGNSIRTWGPDPAALDQAQALGLTVLMGLRVGLPRNGFDYANRERVAQQMEAVRKTVLSMKDHPALLMWAVGNEVELGISAEQRPAVWTALNDIVKAVKQLDPNHPVIIVLAGLGGGKLTELAKYCPDIDAVGVNAYGSMLKVPDVITAEHWTKPWLVTEFGPRGHWEVPKTPWGLPIEDNSTEKADLYLKAYQHTVAGQPRCLGAYVFLWGQKQEKTHTWYGMFLPEGNRTASVDALSYAWTGRWPADRCPRLGSPAITADPGQPYTYEPSARFTARVDVSDPEGQPLTIRWELRRDVSDAPQRGGDAEPSTPPVANAVLDSNGPRATVQLPNAAGSYRLFVYAFDPAGNAATANLPVRIE
jgi:hypothetical protein